MVGPTVTRLPSPYDIEAKRGEMAAMAHHGLPAGRSPFSGTNCLGPSLDCAYGNDYVTMRNVVAVRICEYLDAAGRSAHAKWFDSLNASAAAKVAAALYQLAAGNFSNVKGVGGGVFERRVDFGPGYRIYFGKDGGSLVILLGGSSKQRQQEAVAAAKERWNDYRRRKK